jgi:hypothetical protein
MQTTRDRSHPSGQRPPCATSSPHCRAASTLVPLLPVIGLLTLPPCTPATAAADAGAVQVWRTTSNAQGPVIGLQRQADLSLSAENVADRDDPRLPHFSIDRDRPDVLPLTKQARALDPELALMSSEARGVLNVAFANPDGSVVLIAYNDGNVDKELTVVRRSKSFRYNLLAGASVTFKWAAAPR